MARNPKELLISDALVSFRIHYHDLKRTTLDGYEISIRQYARWLVEPLIDAEDDKYMNTLPAVLTRWSEESCDVTCVDHIWVGRLLRHLIDFSA